MSRIFNVHIAKAAKAPLLWDNGLSALLPPPTLGPAGEDLDLVRVAKPAQLAGLRLATWLQYSFLSVNVHAFQPSDQHREGDLRPLGPPVDVQPARPHHGLDRDYFWTDPMPADPKTLPVYEASHEFDHQQQQQQQQQQHANGPPTRAHLHQADPQRQYRAPPPNSVPPPHMNGNTASNSNNWGLPSNPHQQAFNKRLPPWPGARRIRMGTATVRHRQGNNTSSGFKLTEFWTST
ncbi:hypothetical protein C8J57DRAFT_1533114 [Mycena rebaudengoi]|nr:hypothetical protein C8J57DRAFT_1533114 [Mycena rebaudengoi]